MLWRRRPSDAGPRLVERTAHSPVRELLSPAPSAPPTGRPGPNDVRRFEFEPNRELALICGNPPGPPHSPVRSGGAGDSSRTGWSAPRGGFVEVRVPTTRASATATSWAGTCRGSPHNPPSTRSSPAAPTGCASCAIYGTATGFRDLQTTRRRGDGLQLHAHDLTVYGRQEQWEDSLPGWPQPWSDGAARMRTNGTPHRPAVATRSWTL
jgi:hypothetical protein